METPRSFASDSPRHTPRSQSSPYLMQRERLSVSPSNRGSSPYTFASPSQTGGLTLKPTPKKGKVVKISSSFKAIVSVVKTSPSFKSSGSFKESSARNPSPSGINQSMKRTSPYSFPDSPSHEQQQQPPSPSAYGRNSADRITPVDVTSPNPFSRTQHPPTTTWSSLKGTSPPEITLRSPRLATTPRENEEGDSSVPHAKKKKRGANMCGMNIFAATAFSTLWSVGCGLCAFLLFGAL